MLYYYLQKESFKLAYIFYINKFTIEKHEIEKLKDIKSLINLIINEGDNYS